MKPITSISILCIATAVTAIVMTLNRCNSQSQIAGIETKTDTIVIVRPAEPVVITKAKTKIVKTCDTVFQSTGFVARLDTIIMRDTIKAEFSYPDNLLSLCVSRKPDSTIIENRTVKIETASRSSGTWEKVLYALGGFAGGYILKSLTSDGKK